MGELNESSCDNDDSVYEDDDSRRDYIGGQKELEGIGRKRGDDGQDEIAQTESQVVSFVRFLVFLLLVAVTAGAAVGVYFYVKNAETESFEKDFNDSSDKAFDSIGNLLDQALSGFDSLMGSIVSHQLFINASWPFVTLPHFPVKAQKILAFSGATTLGIYPKVMHKDRAEWEEYGFENQGWVDESLEVQKESPFFQGLQLDTYMDYPHIHTSSGPAPNATKYYPKWQESPIVPTWGAWGWDLKQSYAEDLEEVETKRVAVIGSTLNLPPVERNIQWMTSLVGSSMDASEPIFPLVYPIVENALDKVDTAELEPEKHQVVGVISATIFWRKLFENILAPGSVGLIAVIGGECTETFTFQINGPEVDYLGMGDLHDRKYDSNGRYSLVANLGARALRQRQYSGFPLSSEYCAYWIRLYPSNTMKEEHTSNDPVIFMVVAVSIFVFTSLFFLIYDCVSERRQKKVLQVAVQSSAVVSSLFPKVVRDKIFSSEAKNSESKEHASTARLRLQQFIRNHEKGGGRNVHHDRANTEAAPIAELFSETTVLFADISGFTAWSSVREPAHVFTLLETLYGGFDSLAVRRGVFKVETIGDCYVAVAGLPVPRADHAVIMTKFAADILGKTRELVNNLAKTLGPDTADLEVRIGLNSGPVTAGVLRGERSRFQLFGDTVNTAARMESTGVVSKIHASASTADQLIKAGKSHWVFKRNEEIDAKGKGRLQTFWVDPVRGRSTFHTTTAMAFNEGVYVSALNQKTHRLVDWNVEILVKLLKQVVSRRDARKTLNRRSHNKERHSETSEDVVHHSETILEEVKEVIMLPEFDPALAKISRNSKSEELSSEVLSQLRTYVTVVASMYPENPFHNFEHASHVTMSVVKLLSRIVAPSDDVIHAAEETKRVLEYHLHDHTYGITSDPLTQFACVFSALIHDVDHPGVPNTQLIKEGSPLVDKFKGKSVAEQNSVNISWKLLMEDKFKDLRGIICNSDSEMTRFRQLVVNGVMATDVMDKDLKKLRNERWDKAFSERSILEETMTIHKNRKATIVIEHLLQASDVAHTMQHWHVFRKWNERLFTEMYVAYIRGRSEKNPADFWYKGEMGFFDFYIIPLAKKLSDCGVFGVASDEYLSYAMKNREEWENRGQEEVAKMLANCKEHYKIEVTMNRGDTTGEDAVNTNTVETPQATSTDIESVSNETDDGQAMVQTNTISAEQNTKSLLSV